VSPRRLISRRFGGAAAAVVGVRSILIAGGLLAAATGTVLLIPHVTELDKRATLQSAEPA
jgi:hypothetical protein